MTRIILTLVFVFISTVSFSQNTIFYSNGETKSLKKIVLKFDDYGDLASSLKTVNHVGDSGEENLINVNKVRVDDVLYTVKNYKGKPSLFEPIVIGNLSLFKGKQMYYLENDDYEVREFPKKVVDGLELNRFEFSTLSVFINKCKAAQNEAYLNVNKLTLKQVKDIIAIYNNCNLSDDVQIADEVVEEVNKPNEFLELGISVGYNFMKSSFEDISPGVSNSFGTPVVGAQVYFNSNLIKKQLGFIASVDYLFGNKFSTFANSTYIDSKASYIEVAAGTRFTFKNISSTIQPYLGASGRTVFVLNSYLYTQGNQIGDPLMKYKTENGFGLSASAGFYLNLGKHKIDVALSYLPEVDFKVSSHSLVTEKTSQYTLSGFQIKATYILF